MKCRVSAEDVTSSAFAIQCLFIAGVSSAGGVLIPRFDYAVTWYVYLCFRLGIGFLWTAGIVRLLTMNDTVPAAQSSVDPSAYVIKPKVGSTEASTGKGVCLTLYQIKCIN